MAAPTVTFVGASSLTDNQNPGTSETVTGAAWSAGDDICILGLTEDNGRTLGLPTNANLTFSAQAGSPTNTGSSCKAYAWKATAGSSQSGQTIASLIGGSGSFSIILIWKVASGTSTGSSNPVFTVSTAKTNSITRAGNNSVILWAAGDWSADADVTVTSSPAGGTQRLAATSSGFTGFSFDWPDQGAAGTTSYGVANASGTGNLTKVGWEILGTASGTSITLTPATETDTAQALSFIKPIVVTLTPATETDGAQALSIVHPIIVTLTPAAETDTAQGLSAAHVIPVVPATETDAAVGLSAAKSVSLTPAVETDTAQGLVVTKTIFVSLTSAVETDAAQGLSFSLAGAQHVTLVPATETDTAVPLVFSVVGGGLANRKRYYIQRTGHGVRRRIG